MTSMYPFFRKKRVDHESVKFDQPAPKALAFSALVDDMGDFRDLGVHDVALKFWLPEPAEKAIQELSKINGESMSESLRQFFVIHCYGLYMFSVMTQKMPKLFKDPEPVRFSRTRDADQEADPPGKKRETTYWVLELGKNVAPIKIWVPQRVKADLQVLADHVDITLSQYLREVVISRLLGHGTLPKRPEMLLATPLKAASDWCEDIEVAWTQVSYAQYKDAPLRESRVAWVDDAV